jgi:NAD(P)H-dependent FMN reductase
MLKLKFVIGSTREGRAADLITPWLIDRIGAHGGFDLEVLDLRDWPLPMFAETIETIGDRMNPTYSDPIVKRWNQTIKDGEAFLLLSPEYNHSTTGVLKNAIDNVFVSYGLRNKPCAFVSYSGGVAAGVRAIEHLAHMLIEADATPLRNTVVIPYVHEAFEGTVARSPMTEAACRVMLDDLEWWGNALAAARAQGELPPGTARVRRIAAELTGD